MDYVLMGNNMVVRMFTEDINQKEIRRILDRYFSGYSLFTGLGVWEKKSEDMLCIEIDVSKNAPPNWIVRIQCIIDEIKTINKQDSILVQRIQTISEVV